MLIEPTQICSISYSQVKGIICVFYISPTQKNKNLKDEYNIKISLIYQTTDQIFLKNN